MAEVDGAHERLSGPATRRILQRERQEFRRKEFQRLAGISVSHLYNLRRTARYRKHAAVWEPMRPSGVSIAERRKPEPRGRPGYLRIDTVHQGDWDGNKRVYHINSVDAVTQWEITGAAEKISERFLNCFGGHTGTGKNGAIIRKHIGYGHIAREHAGEL